MSELLRPLQSLPVVLQLEIDALTDIRLVAEAGQLTLKLLKGEGHLLGWLSEPLDHVCSDHENGNSELLAPLHTPDSFDAHLFLVVLIEVIQEPENQAQIWRLQVDAETISCLLKEM